MSSSRSPAAPGTWSISCVESQHAISWEIWEAALSPRTSVTDVLYFDAAGRASIALGVCLDPIMERTYLVAVRDYFFYPSGVDLVLTNKCAGVVFQQAERGCCFSRGRLALGLRSRRRACGHTRRLGFCCAGRRSEPLCHRVEHREHPSEWHLGCLEHCVVGH